MKASDIKELLLIKTADLSTKYKVSKESFSYIDGFTDCLNILFPVIQALEYYETGKVLKIDGYVDTQTKKETLTELANKLKKDYRPKPFNKIN